MIDLLQGLGDTLWLSLKKLGQSFVELVPNLVGAIIIVLIGWIIGKVIKKIIVTLIQQTKIDEWVEEQNLTAAIGGQKISNIVGSFLKWYIIAIFLIQAVTAFQLTVLQEFLTVLAYYIPQIIVALLILVIGLLIGRYVRNIVDATTYFHKRTIGIIAEVIIIYVAIVLGLDTIQGVDVTILLDAFRISLLAFTLTIAIIVGITLGFAFKDDAKDLISEIRKKAK
ncbi:MAG: hypothetical protein AABW72_03635 [archaeon]